MVGDFVALGLTVVGEVASGDVGDFSTPESLAEFSKALSAPSKFSGTHLCLPPGSQIQKKIVNDSTLNPVRDKRQAIEASQEYCILSLLLRCYKNCSQTIR